MNIHESAEITYTDSIAQLIEKDMNTPRTDAAMSDTEEITEIEATCSPSAKRIEQLETELAAVTAKLEKCRAALGGISEYGKMCKGTDAARMKYLADQAIDQTE